MTDARRARSRLTVRTVALAAAAACLASLGAGSARGASTPAFELTVQGSRPAPEGSSERSYASSAPFCPSGGVTELERRLADGWITSLHRFTCADGSGSVTARTWLLGAEDPLTTEWGSWRIVRATGRYRELRGIGTYVRVVVRPEPDSQRAGAFVEAWSGNVDFDAEAPTVHVSKTVVDPVPRSHGEYAVRLDLTARDDVRGRPVSYLLIARSRLLLGATSGTTSSGAASVPLRVRPEPGARTIRLELDASDPVGNQTIVVRSVRVPR